MTQDAAKRRAAAKALELVGSGMRLGLGTGSTAALFVELLGERVAAGLSVACVPTSESTRLQAEKLSIPLVTLAEYPELDLTIDGTDEFDTRLRLIKGGGGALLREKIVAAASKKMVVIADQSKAVSILGKFPLPVEIVAFGEMATRGHLREAARACGCAGDIVLRQNADGGVYVTDNGNLLADCRFGRIDDPEALACAFSAVPGVVEHGLFIGLASAVICASGTGIEIFGDLA